MGLVKSLRGIVKRHRCGRRGHHFIRHARRPGREVCCRCGFVRFREIPVATPVALDDPAPDVTFERDARMDG